MLVACALWMVMGPMQVSSSQELATLQGERAMLRTYPDNAERTWVDARIAEVRQEELAAVYVKTLDPLAIDLNPETDALDRAIVRVRQERQGARDDVDVQRKLDSLMAQRVDTVHAKRTTLAQVETDSDGDMPGSEIGQLKERRRMLRNWADNDARAKLDQKIDRLKGNQALYPHEHDVAVAEFSPELHQLQERMDGLKDAIHDGTAPGNAQAELAHLSRVASAAETAVASTLAVCQQVTVAHGELSTTSTPDACVARTQGAVAAAEHEMALKDELKNTEWTMDNWKRHDAIRAELHALENDGH